MLGLKHCVKTRSISNSGQSLFCSSARDNCSYMTCKYHTLFQMTSSTTTWAWCDGWLVTSRRPTVPHCSHWYILPLFLTLPLSSFPLYGRTITADIIFFCVCMCAYRLETKMKKFQVLINYLAHWLPIRASEYESASGVLTAIITSSGVLY